MTEPPEPRPSSPAHLRPITVEIPATWTAEEALAVSDLLEELLQKIWDRYRCRLQDLHQEQQQSPALMTAMLV
jgi:hypothetical protein